MHCIRRSRTCTFLRTRSCLSGEWTRPETELADSISGAAVQKLGSSSLPSCQRASPTEMLTRPWQQSTKRVLAANLHENGRVFFAITSCCYIAPCVKENRETALPTTFTECRKGHIKNSRGIALAYLRKLVCQRKSFRRRNYTVHTLIYLGEMWFCIYCATFS